MLLLPNIHEFLISPVGTSACLLKYTLIVVLKLFKNVQL
jgi:hypothetical protein